MRRSFVCAVALTPCLAAAEVLDKELPLSALVGASLLLGLMIFWGVLRSRPVLAAVAALVAALLFAVQLVELFDPDVGPVLCAEGGMAYLVASWGIPLVVLVALGLGFILRRRRVKVAP